MKENNLIKRVALFLFTMVLLLGAIALTMNRDLLNVDGFRRWLLYGDLEVSLYGETNAFAHGGGDMASFALMDDGVLLVSKAGSRYYSFRGDVFTERVISYGNPILHTGANATVLYDAGGSWLSVYSDQDEKFSLGNSGTIIAGRMNKNDWLTVVTQESGYRGVVTVYNNQFLPMMNISLSTTYISDAYLSPDNRHIAIVTIGQSAGIFESSLLLYSVNDVSETPQKTLQFSGKVVLDMSYDTDTIFLLCENELIMIDTTSFQPTTWSFDGQYLKDADLGGDGFATLLLGPYRAGTASRLVTVDGAGTVLGELPVNSSPLALGAAGRYVAYLSGEQLIVYHADLTEYSKLEDIRHANEVAVSKDGTVLLASQQEAWLYLPN